MASSTSWNEFDPRLEGEAFGIVICDGRGTYIGFVDAKYDMSYYIHTSHHYDKYRRIAPGEEVEEWPANWMWVFSPQY